MGENRMIFITIDGDTIHEVISAHKNYQSKDYRTVSVPDNFAGFPGDKLAFFDEEWKYKPLSQLIKLGVIQLRDDEKLSGETVVKKTLEEMVSEGTVLLQPEEKVVAGKIEKKTYEELCRDGIEKIPDGMKLIAENDMLMLAPMSLDERVEAGLMSIQEREEIKEKEILEKRQQAYREESDPLFFSYMADDSTKDEWLGKRKEIKERFPKKGNK